MSRFWLSGIAALAIVCAVPAGVEAQNILDNNEFNRNVSSWSVIPGGTFTWSIFDADDASSSGPRMSGSAVLNNQGAGANFHLTTQCFPILFGFSARTWKYGAETRIPVQPANSGFTDITMAAYTSTDCSGAATTSAGSTSNSIADGVYRQVRGVVTLPTGIGSVTVAVWNYKDFAGDFISEFDQVYFLDCDTVRFDINSDDTVDASDLVLGANHLVGNVGCLPTQ